MSFSYLIALADTSNTILNNSVESKHSWLVPQESLLFLSVMLAMGFLYTAFSMMGCVQ